jgi:hypothetical protein
VLSFAATAAGQVTWFRIQALCIHGGERLYLKRVEQWCDRAVEAEGKVQARQRLQVHTSGRRKALHELRRREALDDGEGQEQRRRPVLALDGLDL